MPVRFTRRVALGAAASSMARSALGQARRPLTVMAFGGIFEKIIREQLIPSFEAAHPYAVTLVVGDDATVVPRLISARGRAPYDVITINDDNATYLQSLGLLAPDQSARLTGLADTYDSMKPPRTVIYGTTIYEYDLVYRTDTVKEAPTSWRDLWRPGLTVGVPYIGQSYGLTFLYLAALLNGGTASNLQPGFEALKRLGRIKVYRNVGHGLTLFQQGEIDAALYYRHRAQQMIDMGMPVGRTRPQEGVFAQRTGTQIPKGTGNLEGAIAWVDFSLTARYQGAFVDQYYSPANRTVAMTPDLAAKHILGDAAVAKLRDPPWAELLPQRDALMERWSREISL